MKEKLVIKNFGPIRSVELELGRFNVLIGEQATGKSTVAKVLAVCRYFSYIIWDDSVMDQMESSFSQGLMAWGLKEHVTNDSFIFYECKDYSVTVQHNEHISRNWFQEIDEIVDSKIPIFSPKVTPLSREFEDLVTQMNILKPKSSEGYGYVSDTPWRIPTSFLLNEVKSLLDNPFYFPTERELQSVFELGQASIPNLASFLYNYFVKVDGIEEKFKSETEIEPLNILFLNKNGVRYFKKRSDDKFYLLSNGASGYQSTIPVVLVIKDYLRKNRKKTFIIEEPELNLFPSAQNSLMQYLVDKTMNYGNSTLLTTHSPYVLTSLNNMMYAYQVAKKHENEVAKEVEKQYWLNPDDVSAYMMLADGTSVDIVDREEGLIMAEKIDGISNILSKQFDSLLNIELAPHESDS